MCVCVCVVCVKYIYILYSICLIILNPTRDYLDMQIVHYQMQINGDVTRSSNMYDRFDW